MKYLKQLTIIFGICFIGEMIASLLPFAFPGSIMAMLILSVLLVTKMVKEKDIKETGDFFLEMIGLFIVPGCVALIEHVELIQRVAVPLFIINIIAFFITFITCIATIRFVMKWMLARQKEV